MRFAAWDESEMYLVTVYYDDEKINSLEFETSNEDDPEGGKLQVSL